MNTRACSQSFTLGSGVIAGVVHKYGPEVGVESLMQICVNFFCLKQDVKKVDRKPWSFSCGSVAFQEMYDDSVVGWWGRGIATKYFCHALPG